MHTDKHGFGMPVRSMCVGPLSSLASVLFWTVTCLLVADCLSAAEQAANAMLPRDFRKLLPLHTELGEPRPGDWLAIHHEPGQTFRQYVRGKPIRAEPNRRTIYIQPLGEFSPTEQRILAATVEFLESYFGLPVRIREGLSLDLVPKTARRKPNTRRSEQILTTYVLSDVLKPRLPRGAVAFLALTTADLWPGEGWNYVFGQASLNDGVGIWSIHRFGNPDADDDAFRRCLRRTLRMASHETGHMFSMAHCTLYACNMCGCNDLRESDRRPLEVCPHCLAKLCYATGVKPAKRFEKLIAFYKAHGLTSEQAFCEKSSAVLQER